MTIRESNPEPNNPMGVDGIEFIEYASSQPQALGSLLQSMGFLPVARHRSREVTLYRQGSMNLIVNSHPDALTGTDAPAATPELKAIALRVRDAAFAWRRSQDLGAWEMPTRASAMELNIPGIHGVGDSLIYFVDRYRDFSIYDVDFVPLPGAEAQPPAVAGLHYFGVVQTILGDRTADWVEFYQQLFGFTVLPEGKFFGVLPKGTLLESPCRKFYLQLVEPPPGSEDIEWDEGLLRIGLGAPDVRAAVRALQDRGVVFIDHGAVQPSEKGALTQVYLGGITFELVVSHLRPGASA
jgi:4-hydroxyphenylpyruvate dioxygenase